MTTITEEEVTHETVDEFELALFDSAVYRKPSKIGVKVNGTVWLDRTDENDLELIQQLQPGAAVSWQFEGMCLAGGVRVKTNSDGEVEGTEFVGAVNVHSVYQPPGM